MHLKTPSCNAADCIALFLLDFVSKGLNVRPSTKCPDDFPPGHVRRYRKMKPKRRFAKRLRGWAEWLNFKGLKSNKRFRGVIIRVSIQSASLKRVNLGATLSFHDPGPKST